jgi:hypothetical protein
MKAHKLALLTLSLGTLMTVTGGLSWAGEAGQESAQGATSIGAGALSAISAPLIIAAGAATGDSEMARSGFVPAAIAPSAMAGGVATLAAATVHASVSSAKEIVHIIHASGERLGALNYAALESSMATNCNPRIPTAQATLHKQPKTIPLVVRQQYVEMNEKVTQ